MVERSHWELEQGQQPTAKKDTQRRSRMSVGNEAYHPTASDTLDQTLHVGLLTFLRLHLLTIFQFSPGGFSSYTHPLLRHLHH